MDELRFGLAEAAPADALAAWGCRAIDYGDTVEIVWDRLDCVGPEDRRRELRVGLADRFPPSALEAACLQVARDLQEPVTLYDDGRLRAVARRGGGYVYVAAWLPPDADP